jgi:DNA-binding MarR family transcriptional regulator
MRLFGLMRSLRAFEQEHIALFGTLEDHRLLNEIGFHQANGNPITLKHLFLLDVGSIATLQRRLKRLKELGLVQDRRVASDRRTVALTLTPKCLRIFAKYDKLLATKQRSRSRARAKSDTVGGSSTHNHICALFRGDDERYQVMVPRVVGSMRRSERAVHFLDGSSRQELVNRLASGGIDVAAAQRSGQLVLRDWRETYLRQGRFDKDAMLALLEESMSNESSAAFAPTALFASMEWALEDSPGVCDLLEYEVRLNHFVPRCAGTVICSYDLSKFSAGTTIDVLRAHPAVIIGGRLQDNPFYEPPDEFLRELEARRTAKAERRPGADA